jgi:hypothetical protein
LCVEQLVHHGGAFDRVLISMGRVDVVLLHGLVTLQASAGDGDALVLIFIDCCCLQGGETRKDQMAETHGGDVSAGYSEMGHQVHWCPCKPFNRLAGLLAHLPLLFCTLSPHKQDMCDKLYLGSCK